MTRVLSLDLGRRTGWCLGDRNGYLDSGVFELYSEKGAKEFSDEQRFCALHDFLERFSNIQCVCYEYVGGATKGRQTVLWNGYRAILLRWCLLKGAEVVPYSPGQIKKHVAGKGNAGKQEVIDAVVTLGHLPYDDNEADAIAAFHLWNDTHG